MIIKCILLTVRILVNFLNHVNLVNCRDSDFHYVMLHRDRVHDHDELPVRDVLMVMLVNSGELVLAVLMLAPLVNDELVLAGRDVLMLNQVVLVHQQLQMEEGVLPPPDS